MTEELSEGTDEAEEARPVDAGEPEKPVEPSETEAVSEQGAVSEVEETPEVQADTVAEEQNAQAVSEVEESPDVSESDTSPDATEPEEESSEVEESEEETPSVAEAEPAESSDVDTPEQEEAPQDEATSEPEESPDTEAEPEVGEAVEAASPLEVEATVDEAEAPPEEAPVEAEAPPAPEGEAKVGEEVLPDGDPFSGPGDWYVIHTYAGYENKVKTNLGSRIQTMQMQDKIFDVVVPMEDVMEIKGGRKQVVQKKVFPGYLLVKMLYDNDSWYVVRNTPGVTGFVASGTGQKPTPLPRREVEKFLAAKSEETKPAFRLEYEEGDVVRIISGPFTDFNGTISEINVDQSKLKVMVNIFDRETPVELGFDQVAKV
ncbi:MAG TPA: transcription termination/antitermination protein NusG [Actinomycetota bacterium]|nr:transcription termination/antitermination protein NusG [Actinomycetota bacterium]